MVGDVIRTAHCTLHFFVLRCFFYEITGDFSVLSAKTVAHRAYRAILMPNLEMMLAYAVSD
jgi:hypothetical protein